MEKEILLAIQPQARSWQMETEMAATWRFGVAASA
jgi:hypothetical protein